MGLEASAGVWVVCALSVVAFIVAFQVSGIVARARGVLAVARQAMAVMADKSIDDAEKEAWMQHSSLRLFGQFAWIAAATLGVLAAAGMVLWLGDLAGFAPLGASVDFLSRWQVILGTSVVFIVAFWLGDPRSRRAR